MRLFVAVELEEHVRQAAATAADRLRRTLGRSAAFDARWIPEANLHITLFFLGEVADDRVDDVRAALDRPFAARCFVLDIGGAGAFPPSGPPRVLWLGVRDGAARLAALHDEVSTRLAAVGFEPERRAFSAHLTIARARDPRRPSGGHASVRAALRDARVDAGRSRVSAVTLFRSHLSPKGATYEAILRVPLKDAPKTAEARER